MDKRSLIFMVCLSAAFFGVQAYFSNQRDKERVVHERKVQAEKVIQAEKLKAEFTTRTADITKLPLASLYSDEKGENKIAAAVVCGKHYLAISWEGELPATVYAKEKDTLKAVHLATPTYTAGSPVIYSNKPNLAASIPSIPFDRAIDLQLVTLTGDPKVTLSLHNGGELTLPLQYVPETAIALLSVNNVYLPVGIYDPEAKQIRQLREFKWLQGLVKQGEPIALTPAQGNDEEFYVIETPYQQLVFSSRGGALAEINLPLKTAKDSQSIVREIDIDREILKQSPQNAHFPLHPYYKNGKEYSASGTLGGYYPLLRRTLLNPDGSNKSIVPAECYGLNIVGDDPEISQINYKVTRFEPNFIQFQSTSGPRRITKTFTIPQDRNGPYCLQLDVQIDGDARGLYLTSGVPDVELVGGSYAPLLRYQVMKADGNDVETIDLPKKGPITSTMPTNWVSNCNGFLGLIVDPIKEKIDGYKAVQFDGAKVPTRLSLIDAAYRLYDPASYPGYATYLPLKSGVTQTFRIFAGPFDDGLLKELDELYEDPTIGYNPDYASAQSIQGWFSFISQPFSKFLFMLMNIFYAITHSWAVAIVLLTIALKAMMYPLNSWSIKSTLKMQEIAPKVKAVQERYKKDPRKAQMEVMNLYKESKINPFTGCVPVLLQMPFLIGMFYLLKSSFPLRGAPFIPGWIDDLAAPDVLFSWGQPIWLIGNEFHLLPILMGATMFLQQRFTSKTPKDEKDVTESQKQQKMMGNMMSIMFTVMFYSFPSGLNIYFMFSTLLGLAQQWWMTKRSQNTTIVLKN